jgi:peptide/nickel transport system permease protein
LLGAATAYWRDGWLDRVVTGVTLVLSALPEFVIATSLILLFATGLWKVLPATSTATQVLAHPTQIVLPAMTLALAIAPYIIRMMRATLIDVLESDYIEHARLSGLSERVVVFRYALINTLGAIAQVAALQLAYLAGGVVVVEFVFGFPGIGTSLVDAVSNRDLPVIQPICLFIAVFYIIVNLIADLLTALANPRVRHAGK